jgi:hypothetical protein
MCTVTIWAHIRVTSGRDHESRPAAHDMFHLFGCCVLASTCWFTEAASDHLCRCKYLRSIGKKVQGRADPQKLWHHPCTVGQAQLPLSCLARACLPRCCRLCRGMSIPSLGLGSCRWMGPRTCLCGQHKLHQQQEATDNQSGRGAKDGGIETLRQPAWS